MAILLEKQGSCPNCYRFGQDKGAYRFTCKDRGYIFGIYYTCIYGAGIRKDGLGCTYMLLVVEQKYFDKISVTLHIKKNAFDWRHKIIGSLKKDECKDFPSIMESDETFFEKSEKDSFHLKYAFHKRSGGSHTRGISKNWADIIVTTDRKNDLNMTFCGYDRFIEKERSESLCSPLYQNTILYSDAYVSYQGYATDDGLERVVIMGDLCLHFNLLDSQLKKWIAKIFCGVLTTFLQDYLNRFKTIYRPYLRGHRNWLRPCLIFLS